MRISYYPGCTLKTTAKGFETSAMAVLKKLDIEPVELPRWNCCGTVYSMASDNVMYQLAPIRNLMRTKEQGDDKLLVLCSMCYNTLKRANILVQKKRDTLDLINDFTYLEKVNYDGSVEVIHVIEILRDKVKEIKKNVKKTLKGLKVATYYGCTLVRPKEVGIDNMENPEIMNPVLEALGAEPVYFPYSVECCGSYHTVTEKKLVIDRTYEIINSARENGAHIVLTSCPLCHFNLDARQKNVMETYPDFKPLPVIYITQLLSYAFGFGDEVNRFDLNFIDPKQTLESINA